MRLPSGGFGNRLADGIFTNSSKKLPTFFGVDQNFIYAACDIKLNSCAVHVPEITQGKVRRALVAGEMTVETGWANREKAEENFVKGKFLKYGQ